MNESYFMSFMGGASGRFLSGIFWEMKSKHQVVSQNLQITKYNSGHNIFNYWPGCINGGGWRESIFDDLKFTYDNSPGIGYTFSHYYPKWQKIQSNPEFNSTKFIIISLDIDDIKEIHINGFIKNDLSAFEQKVDPSETNIYQPKHFYSAYCDAFGYVKPEDFYSVLTDSKNNNRIKILLNAEISNILNNLDSREEKYYLDLPMPESFIDKVTVIKYKDIYTKSSNGNYIALEKLAGLANCEPSDAILKKYEEYVAGRERLIFNYKFMFD